MAVATRFVQPMDYYGSYRTNSWAGYVFKEALGYTSGVHTGVDYNGAGAGNADLGMQVRAIANGRVVAIENRSDLGFGLTMIIQHDLGAVLKRELGCDALFSRYMHLKAVHVAVGQDVSISQGIAELGNSGTVWAHLHLDLYRSTIDGGGVHWRYDKNTELASYLDTFSFIEEHLSESEPNASVLEPYQRMVGAVGVNYRELPNTSSTIIKEFVEGEILDFKGFVHGEAINGNDIWFIGKYSGGACWSGAMTDASTRGLADLSPVTTPVPEAPADPPVIEKPAPAMFVPDSPLVSRVIPSPNFTTEQTPKFIVIHQWGKKTDNFTLQGVINGFLAEDGLAAPYIVDDPEIVQMVQERYRAQHAGPTGNDGIGIELNPNGGEAMYARARALIGDIRMRWGNLPLVKHSDVASTECPNEIDMARLELPAVEPTEPHDPTGLTDLEELKKDFAVNTALLKQLLDITIWIRDLLSKIFK